MSDIRGHFIVLWVLTSSQCRWLTLFRFGLSTVYSHVFATTVQLLRRISAYQRNMEAMGARGYFQGGMKRE